MDKINNPKRCIIYVRVSTGGQADEGYSIEMQRERLIAYCTARGWIISDIIIDPGYSGSNLERPGIQQIIENAQAKKMDAVLVYKLDRISRSQKDVLYLLEDIFLPNGVDFVSMQESFDTSTPFGRASISILSVFSQLERELIAERTMMGRQGRAKNGLWHGGGTDPIGYDYIDGELVINKREATQIRRVYNLYASGHSIEHIKYEMADYTHKHGDWRHGSTIQNVLDNPLYIGTVHFGGVEAHKSHDSIIDHDLHQLVQYLRSRQKKANYKQKSSKHLLTGLVYCKRCGARYFPKSHKSGNVYYTCYSRAKTNKKMVKDPTCKNDTWLKEELERIVIGKLIGIVRNPHQLYDMQRENKKNAASNSSAVLAKAHVELEETNRKIKNTMALYQNDQMPVDEVSAAVDVLYQRKMELLRLLGEKSDNSTKKFKIEGFKLILADFNDSIKKDGLLLRGLLPQLLDKVEIDGEDIYFQWPF